MLDFLNYTLFMIGFHLKCLLLNVGFLKLYAVHDWISNSILYLTLLFSIVPLHFKKASTFSGSQIGQRTEWLYKYFDFQI